jgi:hypothetical protein
MKIGWHMKSPEKREARRVAMSGDGNPAKRSDVRAKLSAAHKGRTDAPEKRLRTSLRMKGNTFNLGRKFSEEHRAKISAGIKARYDIKGRVTSEDTLIRNSAEYAAWRAAVFARDNYQCVVGGKAHGSRLHADHIKPFAEFPDLRFDLDNGRTLCIPCHRKTEKYGRKLTR